MSGPDERDGYEVLEVDPSIAFVSREAYRTIFQAIDPLDRFTTKNLLREHLLVYVGRRGGRLLIAPEEA